MCEDAGDLRGEEHLESHRVVVLDVACSNPLSLEVSESEQVAVDCGDRCKVPCFLRRSSQLPSVAILPAWPNVGHPPLEHPSAPLLAALLSQRHSTAAFGLQRFLDPFELQVRSLLARASSSFFFQPLLSPDPLSPFVVALSRSCAAPLWPLSPPSFSVQQLQLLPLSQNLL